MLSFIIRRLLLAVATMWAITVLSFTIIQLPPGDFVDAYIARLSASGSSVSAAEAQNLRLLYGLDQPYVVQYGKWMGRMLRGDFGESMEWQRPVSEVLGDRLWMTVALSFAALLLTWGLALPIGIYSAVRQYSFGDYAITTLGFIGLAVPNFLLALIILYLSFRWFGANVGGLFSAEMELAPWGWAKFADLMWHLPLPALILAIAGTAQLIRIMRANLLDELRKPYVVTARAKGLSEMRVILKYPVRAALNLEKVALVGDSYGGMLAMAYAAAHPEHVARLVLSDSAAPSWNGLVHQLPQTFPDIEAEDEVEQKQLGDGTDAAAQASLRNHFRMIFYSPARRDAYLARMGNLGFEPAVAGKVENATADLDLTPQLAGFTTFPTLVITGRYDMNVAPLTAWRIAHQIPGARIVFFERSGHLPAYEEPIRYRKVLEAFLEGR